MIPLLVFVTIALTTRAIGWLTEAPWLDEWAMPLAIGIAVMFALTASAHFLEPRRAQLLAMVPPQLGNAGAWVTLTGILELAGAVGLLLPWTAHIAAAGLGLLLVAMFPANVHAVCSQTGIRTMPLPVRAVVQLIYLAACAVVAIGI